MNRIVLFIACFFAILAGALIFWIRLQSNRIDTLQAAKTTLEANNNLLINRLEKEHNDKLELSKRTAEIEEAIKKDTSGFDWNYNLSDNSVLVTFKRMHHK